MACRLLAGIHSEHTIPMYPYLQVVKIMKQAVWKASSALYNRASQESQSSLQLQERTASAGTHFIMCSHGSYYTWDKASCRELLTAVRTSVLKSLQQTLTYSAVGGVKGGNNHANM